MLFQPNSFLPGFIRLSHARLPPMHSPWKGVGPLSESSCQEPHSSSPAHLESPQSMLAQGISSYMYHRPQAWLPSLLIWRHIS